MADKLTIDPNKAETVSSEDEVRVTPASQSWSFVSARHARRVPLFMPRDQTYYWTREWQEGIRRSMTDLEAGNYTDYSPDNPGAITRRFGGEED